LRVEREAAVGTAVATTRAMRGRRKAPARWMVKLEVAKRISGGNDERRVQSADAGDAKGAGLIPPPTLTPPPRII